MVESAILIGYLMIGYLKHLDVTVTGSLFMSIMHAARAEAFL